MHDERFRWFDKYAGRHTHDDLTEENLMVKVVSSIDDLILARSGLNHMLGDGEGPFPPEPPTYESHEAASRWLAERFASVRSAPIGQSIEIIWRIAQQRAVEDGEVERANRACLDILKMFAPLGFRGPVMISELDDDSPLLFALTIACKILWDRGLAQFLQRGHWFVVYSPSHAN